MADETLNFNVQALTDAVNNFGVSVSEFAQAMALSAEIDRVKTQLAMVMSYEDVDKVSEWAVNHSYAGIESYIDWLERAYSMILSGESLEDILKS